MARAHNTGVHVCVRKPREGDMVHGWGGAFWVCLRCYKECKPLKTTRLYPGCAGVDLCHVSLTVKPIIFMSKSSVNLFLLQDKALDPLSQRLFFYFPNSFFFIEAPLLISAKHTPASFLLHTDTTLLCIQSFGAPFRGNLLLCAIHSC